MGLAKTDIAQRELWIENIHGSRGDFATAVEVVESQLRGQFQSHPKLLLGHLRFCGVIPEVLAHDSTAEKLYSKYTDILLALAFEALGIASLVVTERSDTADVECVAKDFAFVADAKAFRLSRTAKNQKDFKIAAMHTWKRGKPFAMVVCPLFQLPNSKSQIYQQAASLNVCLFSYTHLVVLLRLVKALGQNKVRQLLQQIFQTVAAMNPSQDAVSYWKQINSQMLDFAPESQAIWLLEKEHADSALKYLKDEALTYVAQERERIMRMSRANAIKELLKANNLDSRVKVIEKVSSNQLFEVQQ